MDKKKIIFFSFQTLVAIGAIIAIIYVLIDFIHTLPLCKAYLYSLDDVQPILYQNAVGKVVLYMQSTDTENFLILAKEAILSFLRYLHPICIVFLIFTILSLGFYSFSNEKEGKNYLSYLPFFTQLILVYLGKFLVSAAIFGVFYRANIRSIGTGLTAMSYCILIANLVIIFYCTLFILKFILSIKPFIHQIRENH